MLHEKHLPEPPKPGTLDFRLVTLIKEGATIDEMILALHATDFYLYQRLYALYRLEAVTVLPSEPPSESSEEVFAAEEVSNDEVVSQVRTLMEAGRLGEAELAARKARRLSPTQETSDLLHDAENALLAKLRQTLMGEQVPVLKVAAAELKSLPLSAPERYLLSRINGTRTLSSIVHASPIQELEALKFFQRFIDTGLVKLG